MVAPLKNLTSTVARICDRAEEQELVKQARKLCREYVKKNAGTPGLGSFAANEVKVSFARQISVFRQSSKTLTPNIRTELSLDVYGGHAELGTFTLISRLDGKTEYTQVDIDCGIARDTGEKE